MRLKYIGPGNYFQVSGRELPVHEMYHLVFLLVFLVSSQARKRSRARRRRISFDFNCQSRCGKYNTDNTWESLEYLHGGCTAMEGNPRKALILNANVYNHCIRYKIPSGPVNVVGSLLKFHFIQYITLSTLSSRVSRFPISPSFEEEGEGPGGIVHRHSSSNKEECERTWERARSASQERAREKKRSRSWLGRGDSSPWHCFEMLHVTINVY